jgi:S-adenosylmethionine:tRNA ribosyltransferase-isomerase
MDPFKITIRDYTYQLPEEKIALYPLEQRDASKMLVYKKGTITEHRFNQLAENLPANSLLVFNNTKVINARLRFKKDTGASIEIFCLEPLGAINEYTSVMNATGSVLWKCLVGGAAKWKKESLGKRVMVNGAEVLLSADKVEKLTDAYSIRLSWSPAHYSFAAIVEAAGDTPLPPYIKRDTDNEDSSRYQTIFAREEGSVAAPTAGLHFTEKLFEELTAKGIRKTWVTLHVGAGTFKPVKAHSMQNHEMHAEYIDVSKASLIELINNDGPLCAVGTTSLRTLESLYWMGVKTLLQPGTSQLSIAQWDVYREPLISSFVPAKEALEALLHWMDNNNLDRIFTQTQLLIAPGYRFRLCNMLVTNFHQPESTLLLLVAAAIGDDWKKMYDYALQNNFRFLSYGDGNLVFINQ